MKLLLVAHGSHRVVAACSRRGRCQLLSFFNELEGDLREQADRMLTLLEEVALSGPPRNTDRCHWIEKNIWQFEEGRIRILWFNGGQFEGLPNIVCSHGFKKTTQKTPIRQKDLIKGVRRQYFQDLKDGSIEIIEEEEV
jgi:phage-related protein